MPPLVLVCLLWVVGSVPLALIAAELIGRSNRTPQLARRRPQWRHTWQTVREPVAVLVPSGVGIALCLVAVWPPLATGNVAGPRTERDAAHDDAPRRAPVDRGLLATAALLPVLDPDPPSPVELGAGPDLEPGAGPIQAAASAVPPVPVEATAPGPSAAAVSSTPSTVRVAALPVPGDLTVRMAEPVERQHPEATETASAEKQQPRKDPEPQIPRGKAKPRRGW
jgi:hypothetical protein